MSALDQAYEQVRQAVRQAKALAVIEEDLLDAARVASLRDGFKAEAEKYRAEVAAAVQEREATKADTARMLDLARKEAAGIKAKAQADAERMLADVGGRVSDAERKIGELRAAHDVLVKTHEAKIGDLGDEVTRLQNEHERLSTGIASLKEKFRPLVA